MGSRTSTIVRRVRKRVVLSIARHEPVLRGILEQAHALDWDLVDLSFSSGSLPDNPPPAGAIVSCLPTDPLVLRLREMGCPAIRVGTMPHQDDPVLPVVRLDLEASGRMAAEHFAERAFRHVAYVGHKPWSDFRPLYEAFRERAQELGCTCHLHQLKSEREPGESEMARYDRRAREVGAWLAGLARPVGVFGYSDRMAASICTMCGRAGLAVPEDVAVLGFGNDEVTCRLSPVDLSSVDVAADEEGRQAVLLLQRLMNGEDPPAAPVMIQPRGVVERQSTNVLAVPDHMVAGAMRFMWDHLDLDLSVDDVARQVGSSRRKLERSFRTHLGRGINAELHRKRMEVFCQLLLTTNDSIADLAPKVGFRTLVYLHQCFRRSFGMTPRQYRARAHQGDAIPTT